MEVRSALSRLVNRADPIYTGNTQPRGSHLASSGAPSVTENYGLPEAGSRLNLSLGLAQFLGLRTCSGCSEYYSGFQLALSPRAVSGCARSDHWQIRGLSGIASTLLLSDRGQARNELAVRVSRERFAQGVEDAIGTDHVDKAVAVQIARSDVSTCTSGGGSVPAASPAKRTPPNNRSGRSRARVQHHPVHRGRSFHEVTNVLRD